MRAQITEFRSTLNSIVSGQPFDLKSMTDLRNLETIVMIEAQMVAFLNDFVFLVVIAFGAIPLVFLLRGRTKTN
jgi:hypothetical protein